MKEIIYRGDNQPPESQENRERPRYRFYFHGTFGPSLGSIKDDGFKYSEYNPNLTISPSYGFRFVDSEIAKGAGQLKKRGKRLNPEKRNGFDPASIGREDGVLLVIEPPVGLNIHTTNQGMPNQFTPLDQLPEDMDGSIRTKVFVNKQYEVRGAPFTEIRKGEVKHPGMSRNHKRIITEKGDAKWVHMDESDKLKLEGVMPPSSVKMVIERNEVFEGILNHFKTELKSGNPVTKEILEIYRRQLLEYLRSGSTQMLVPMTDADLNELVSNMLTGEMEQYIVSEIRSIYLLVERYKGKRVFDVTRGKEVEKFVGKTKSNLFDDIIERIGKLRNLEPGNEVLKRYIETYTNRFESKLGE